MKLETTPNTCQCGLTAKNRRGLSIHQSRCYMMNRKADLHRLVVQRNMLDQLIQKEINYLSTYY